VSHTRNRELVLVAGERADVRRMIAAAEQVRVGDAR
jgi:hypothetical protein